MCRWIILLVLLSPNLWAKNKELETKKVKFSEALLLLQDHQLVRSQFDEAASMKRGASKAGSWGDPKLSLKAMNLPKEDLSTDRSMMTGLQIGVGQKISFSGKFSKLEEAMLYKGEAFESKGELQRRELSLKLWKKVILKEKWLDIHRILKENLNWVKGNLKVSNRLYSNGKIPQQGVLDIQIRKSELESKLSNIESQIKVIDIEISEILGSAELIEIVIDPKIWKSLTVSKDETVIDYKLENLEKEYKSAEAAWVAKKRNMIPDVEVGFNYTKRNDIDGLGDFVGASLTFEIPTSSKRFGEKEESYYQKLSAQKKLEYYKKSKPHALLRIKTEIEDFQRQIHILNESTLKFSRTSRDIISKSYVRGQSDYLELLRSELQYQNQRIDKVNLVALLRLAQLNYRYIAGDSLMVH